MKIEYFRTLWDYNYGLHARVWECIDHISDGQFVEEVDYSIGSIRNHYVHLASVDRRWLARLTGAVLPEGLKYGDFPTRKEVRVRWEQVAADMLSYINNLSEAQLDDVVQYDIPHRGGTKRSLRWHILLHIANHGTDHRAQVLPILFRLGAPTLEQDLIIHLWDHEHGLV
jgi:uncharacterized damage-inducible protein DinB